jgi:hypothetical protein
MRRLSYLIAIALVIGSFNIDGLAKRSRGGRAKSSARASKGSRSKATRGREAPGRAARGGKLSRRERRELARSSKPSRRERREVARSGGRGLVRERVVVRGRHGRRVVRYRYVRPRADSDTVVAAPAPRPTGGSIASERVTEIQNALIKAGYLEGPASGQYDDTTTQAMKQYQAANKLPETGLPSAPVLKKLGVAKRSNDSYAVPVNRVSEADKKPAPQMP